MKIIKTFSFLLVILVVLFVGVFVSSSYYNEKIDFCDEKFGVDNWELEETTGDRSKCKGIGQCWECVER